MLRAERVALLSIGASIGDVVPRSVHIFLPIQSGCFPMRWNRSSTTAGIVALLVLTVATIRLTTAIPTATTRQSIFQRRSRRCDHRCGHLIIWAARQRFASTVALHHLPLGVAISLVASAVNYGVAWYMLRAAGRDSITLEAEMQST